jgi:D-glycero-alpha-D-manno-heptose 1-phosphate guanylyltransferase
MALIAGEIYGKDKSRMSYSSKSTKAVLLVGGLGTRLRSVVSSTPKPLASVGERPFLELLVQQLRSQGIRRLVLCIGYLAHEIEKQLGDGRKWQVAIEYSKEPHAMGTGGAVKFAEPLLRDVSDFLVMNGDSFMETDFQELINSHRKSGGIATIAVLRMKNEMRYGTVQMTTGDRVSGFTEKSQGDGTGFVNAGIYVFNRRIFDYIPEGPVSLEKDIFPKLLDHGLYASKQHGVFIDIGTPEDYTRAQGLVRRLYEAARSKEPPGISD